MKVGCRMSVLSAVGISHLTDTHVSLTWNVETGARRARSCTPRVARFVHNKLQVQRRGSRAPQTDPQTRDINRYMYSRGGGQPVVRLFVLPLDLFCTRAWPYLTDSPLAPTGTN